MTSSPGGRRSPAANGNGYESPTEEVQNVLFSSQPSGATTPIRPSLVSRASHMVAMHPTGHTGRTNSSGLNDILAQTEKQVPNGKVSIKDRIACHQWTYFTMTMATGGMANVLYSLNWSSVWILGVGKFFFILNLVLFLINCVLISIRFYIRPGSLTHSFTDQVESLFIPSFVRRRTADLWHELEADSSRLCPIIMINTCQYGVPSCGIWLLRTMEIMFWIYVGLSVLTSAGIYLILWSTLVFPVHTMTPTWVFPAYPLLLTAPFASNLIGAAQKTSFSLSINSTAVAFCAVTTQGTGTLIAFMISAAFIYRLMTQKLPRDPQRPGVFMSIGPFGFTASSVAQLGQQASMYIPDDFLGMPHTVAIIQVVSLLVSLWLWGLAFWFFIVSVGSLWKYVRVGSHLPFQMTWWSFVFPNTALVTATGVIGGVFKSKGLDIFASVMTAFLVIVWAYVFITMLRGLKRRKLMWPKNNS